MNRLIRSPKRRAMIEALSWDVARCRRYQRIMSILLLGLDQPTSLNPQAASRRLGEIGRLARRNVRDVDLIASYGPSELLVLLPETPEEGAWMVAERLRSVIEGRQQSASSTVGRSPLTVSIGIAGYPQDGGSVDVLLDAAEEALDKARALGGNRTHLAGGS